MQLDITRNEANEVTGLTITDGTLTLTLTVTKLNWQTFGTLSDGRGRSWAHNSVAAINLLILHAHDAADMAALLADLGPSDESLAKLPY